MKTVLFAIIAAIILSACSSVPTASQVNLIELACQQDMVLRPAVTILAPTVATADEMLAIKAAENAIDIVCANPTATPSANAQAAMQKGIQDLVAIEATMLSRRNAVAK